MVPYANSFKRKRNFKKRVSALKETAGVALPFGHVAGLDQGEEPDASGDEPDDGGTARNLDGLIETWRYNDHSGGYELMPTDPHPQACLICHTSASVRRETMYSYVDNCSRCGNYQVERLTAPNDYSVREDGQPIGRIRATRKGDHPPNGCGRSTSSASTYAHPAPDQPQRLFGERGRPADWPHKNFLDFATVRSGQLRPAFFSPNGRGPRFDPLCAHHFKPEFNDLVAGFPCNVPQKSGGTIGAHRLLPWSVVSEKPTIQEQTAGALLPSMFS